MTNLFWGLLLVLLDFNLNLGQVTIGLLPDFLGFYLVMKGAQALPAPAFGKVRPMALAMAAYTGVLYVLDLTGIGGNLGVFGWVLGLVSLAVQMAILYYICLGVTQLQTQSGRDLGAEKLKPLWMALLILQGITQLLVWVPVVDFFAALGCTVVAICYLVAFYGAKKAYES